MKSDTQINVKVINITVTMNYDKILIKYYNAWYSFENAHKLLINYIGKNKVILYNLEYNVKLTTLQLDIEMKKLRYVL